MNSFKKRATTLLLATIISIGSAFANTYKNNIKALKFENGQNGAINISIQTEKPYEKAITLNKRDASTYILILPEVKNIASTPDFSEFTNSITSVNVNTLPYTANGNGYTRITIKTNGSTPLTTSTKTYILTPEEEESIRQREQMLHKNEEEAQNIQEKSVPKQDDTSSYSTATTQRTYTPDKISSPKTEQKQAITEENTETNTDHEIATETSTTITDSNYEDYTNSSNTEQMMLIMAILVIISISIMLYIRAKDRMTDLAGEKIEINIEEEEKSTPKTPPAKIATTNKTIKTTSYPKTPVINSNIPIKTVSKENTNIVDLDELFQETKMQTEEEENAALEEFLNGFSFNDEFAKQDRKSVV